MASESNQLRYTVIIQWDEEDQCYIVSLPEWGPYAKTHGATYEEAAKNAREVLELLLDGEADPPAPKLFQYPGADVQNLPETAVGPQSEPKKQKQTA
jgi:predicted RNase H-like HicB family nuclease